MLPLTLALIDDDTAFSEYLSQFLRGHGVAAQWYSDSDDVLCSDQAFGFDFYIVDLMLPGVDGISLVRLLRKRSKAGILVVTGKQSDDVFGSVITAGADMHLAKPVSFEQVLMAIKSIYRRSAGFSVAGNAWKLDAGRRQLSTPAGVKVELSPTDLAVLQCLAESPGVTVARDVLHQQLGLRPEDDDNLLNAAIYRLRRRIEGATGAHAPLQARSRAGYVFRAPLEKL